MPKPLFFLVAGPNGAGKSTFTSDYRRHYPFLTVVDPDAIARLPVIAMGCCIKKPNPYPRGSVAYCIFNCLVLTLLAFFKFFPQQCCDPR